MCAHQCWCGVSNGFDGQFRVRFSSVSGETTVKVVSLPATLISTVYLFLFLFFNLFPTLSARGLYFNILYSGFSMTISYVYQFTIIQTFLSFLPDTALAWIGLVRTENSQLGIGLPHVILPHVFVAAVSLLQTIGNRWRRYAWFHSNSLQGF